MSLPRPYAADDVEVISRRLNAIIGQKRAVCPRWADPSFAAEKCWCHKAGADGETLPCPPRPQPPG